jgi:hypothetical protein
LELRKQRPCFPEGSSRRVGSFITVASPVTLVHRLLWLLFLCSILVIHLLHAILGTKQPAVVRFISFILRVVTGSGGSQAMQLVVELTELGSVVRVATFQLGPSFFELLR